MGIIGIDIGGTKTAVLLGTEKGEILKRVSFHTQNPLGVQGTLEKIFSSIMDLIKGHPNIDQINFGISCGGPLDTKKGYILSPPNLPGWDSIPITHLIESEFGGRAFLMNDADASAIAEWKYGAAQGFNHVVFLTFGTGLGAGLILDNRLYVGTSGLAGEAGHIRLAEQGPYGYRKYGSFEGFCSGGGIKNLTQQLIKKAWEQGKSVSFCPSEQNLAQITAKDVAQAAYQGDELAREILEISAHYLGRGLSILIDLLNPQIIVIGSIYARCYSIMSPIVREVVQKEALAKSAEDCRIVPAALGEQIGDYAAMAVVQYHMGLFA